MACCSVHEGGYILLRGGAVHGIRLFAQSYVRWGGNPLPLTFLKTSLRSVYSLGTSTRLAISGLSTEVEVTLSIDRLRQCSRHQSDHCIISLLLQDMWGLCNFSHGCLRMMGYFLAELMNTEVSPSNLILREMVGVQWVMNPELISVNGL